MTAQDYKDLFILIISISVILIVVAFASFCIFINRMAKKEINPEEEYYSSHDFPLIVEEDYKDFHDND